MNTYQIARIIQALLMAIIGLLCLKFGVILAGVLGLGLAIAYIVLSIKN